MTINERIITVQSEVDSNNEPGAMVELIRERYNCSYASVDPDGSVWIEAPMTGRWLSDEEKAELIDWISKQ